MFGEEDLRWRKPELEGQIDAKARQGNQSVLGRELLASDLSVLHRPLRS